MLKLAPIELIHEGSLLTDSGLNSSQILEFSIDIGHVRLPLQISVPDRPARLSELVPLAYAICTRMVDSIKENLEDNHIPVACKKGCSACCHYLVALSLPEINYMQEILSEMPQEYHRHILRKCLQSARKILKDNPEKPHMAETTELDQISRWYAGLNLPCPFLSDGECAIYDHRPLACREHLVKYTSQYCESSCKQQADVVTLPFSILEAMGQLEADLEMSEVQAIILPLAFINVEDCFERSIHSWPAIELVRKFIQIIQASATASHHISAL